MKIAALIMSAGQASRFEACKQLARVTRDGESMLLCAISKLKALPLNDIYLITGYWHDQIKAELEKHQPIICKGTPLHLLHNPDWADGLGSSIACAMQNLKSDYDAVLITLADQVAINTDDLQSLIDGLAGFDAACAFYRNKPGAPAIFKQTQFENLSRLSGDKGAKAVLCQPDIKLNSIEMLNAAIDIDTQAELKQWQSHYLA